MSKLIQERIDVVDPDWKEPWYDKFTFFPHAEFIRNEKVNKLFEEKKVLNWQINGGYIWLEIKDEN